MPGNYYVSGQWNVICLECNQNKLNTDFYIHSNGLLRKQCKTCVLSRRKKTNSAVRNKSTTKYRLKN